ncbi:hypothetical protein [Bradyrhizobium ivorense]|uniref:hypothetical protein n=1 Tax=Bradyrhizobium ivorense TaxID=2511166 RepID=UPI0010BB7853|nr:hypothetical protein [Bradyrhizobium ivorense]VIO76510.1 hypothetical protein CI41S_52450 [Bradyrhizobium ivorense]
MPDTLPPFPTIDSLSWAPPAQTAPTEAARIDNVSLNIYADADNANYQDWVSDVPRGSGNPRLNNWWSGQAPRSPRRLVLRHYWRLVPGTFTHLSPGSHLRQSWQYTSGISTTVSQSITAQVGISADGISAGLSATFGRSVTVSSQTSTTTEYSVDPPASGTRVWMLWDLMYDFSVVDQNTGTVIPAGTYRGDVDFSGDRHYSGAYLSYPWTHLVVSSGNLVSQDRIFPAA